MSGPVPVTGANGHLGRLVLRALAEDANAPPARAVVRSQRAADGLADLPFAERREVRVVDYADRPSLEDAVRGASAVIHLAGILKQTRANRYRDAHERPAEALARACAATGVARIVHTSIHGANTASTNGCLASRGRADETLLAGAVPAVILRVPMVLGPGDAATQGLRRAAMAGRAALTRGGATIEQPIAAHDVVAALLAATNERVRGNTILELAGPERLTHRELVLRVAAILGREVSFRSIPHFAAYTFAWLAETLQADPPLTRDMLGVLEQDDVIDPAPAREALGLSLTPLDAALRTALGEETAT